METRARGLDGDSSLVVAVMGATGNLAAQKLLPALYNLHQQGFLPEWTRFLCVARTPLDPPAFRARLRATLTPDYNRPPAPAAGSSPTAAAAAGLAAGSSRGGHGGSGVSTPPLSPAAKAGSVDDFLKQVEYIQAPAGGYGVPGALAECIARAEQHEAVVGPRVARNRLFYLALPEEVMLDAARAVRADGHHDRGFVRVIVEKPFGRDVATASAMEAELRALFPEDSLYRIDRYLGKEIMENLLVMRFANRMLAPIWNRDNVHNVQIIFKEPFGAGDQNRSRYFDRNGIVRDVLQNHLLQLLAYVAMEKPVSLEAADIRAAKHKVLRQVEPMRMDRTVLGQYTEGASGHPGYADEDGVAEGSTTPTFIMSVLNVRNERWDGVPFIIKAGKALNERRAEIRLQLRDVPGDLFDDAHGSGWSGDAQGHGRNELVVRMQPTEEVYMKMTIKAPGLGFDVIPSEMELGMDWREAQLRKVLTGEAPRRAFERLIVDCISGAQGNFVGGDELIAAWQVCEPVLRACDAGEATIHPYPYGSRGPEAADALRHSTGHMASIVPRDGVPLASSDDLIGLEQQMAGLTG